MHLQLHRDKLKQMQWSKEGAHLLLQTRVRTLNGELAGIFKRWSPELDIKAAKMLMAASPLAFLCSRLLRLPLVLQAPSPRCTGTHEEAVRGQAPPASGPATPRADGSIRSF